MKCFKGGTKTKHFKVSSVTNAMIIDKTWLLGLASGYPHSRNTRLLGPDTVVTDAFQRGANGFKCYCPRVMLIGSSF
jgi:hypothetical protein